MPRLEVKGLPQRDSGRLLVRLNHRHRDGVKRYGLARLTNNETHKSMVVLMLGHDEDSHIFMPYDIRTALLPSNSTVLDFSIKRVGIWGHIVWYVRSPDPAVYIPAWLAIIGMILGIIGLIVGILPFLMSGATAPC